MNDRRKFLKGLAGAAPVVLLPAAAVAEEAFPASRPSLFGAPRSPAARLTSTDVFQIYVEEMVRQLELSSAHIDTRTLINAQGAALAVVFEKMGAS